MIPFFFVQAETSTVTEETTTTVVPTTPSPPTTSCVVVGDNFNTFDNLEYTYEICDHVLMEELQTKSFSVSGMREATFWENV